MIFGVGTDIVNLGHIQAILEQKTGERFVERLLTQAERSLALQRESRRIEFVAGRFAGKEAVVKAFGCGIGNIVGLQDIEILPDATGKPTCALSAKAWMRLGLDPAATRIHISLSHSGRTAIAFAVVEV